MGLPCGHQTVATPGTNSTLKENQGLTVPLKTVIKLMLTLNAKFPANYKA